jgi:HlyD family secretion protein
MMKYKFLIVWIGLSLLFTACSAGGNPGAATPEVIPTVIADTSIIAEGRLEPVRYVEIASNVSGVVSEVLVEEGQTVKKGEPLLRLGDELDRNYAAAQLELANAQKALNDLRNASQADLAQAVIDLKQTKEDYADAVVQLNYLQNSKKVPISETFVYYFTTHKGIDIRYRRKDHKGPAPQAWIIHAENDLALKKAKMEEAQNTYDRMKDTGMDRDQLAVLEARLTAANAKVAAFSVTAPFDGVVTDLNAKLGSSINAGEPAVTIADFSHWIVNTTDLTEIDVVALAEGQPATVTLDALPDVGLNGTIRSIGQTYSENQGDVVYEVTILLSDTQPAMRWGMTAAVTFESDT